MRRWLCTFVLGSLLGGCGTAKPGGMSGPTIGSLNENKTAPLESGDILRRSRTAQPVSVKHVLIGWDDLAENYDGKLEEAAKNRTRFEAEDLVRKLVAKLNGGHPIEPLMIDHSNDVGTKGGQALVVTSAADFVPRFIAISIRLNVGEIGVVKTGFGYHIVKRVK